MAKYWDITMISVSLFFLNLCTRRMKDAIEITIDKRRLNNPR